MAEGNIQDASLVDDESTEAMDDRDNIFETKPVYANGAGKQPNNAFRRQLGQQIKLLGDVLLV